MIGRPKTPIRMLPPSQIVPRPARVARGRRGRAGGGGRQQKQRVGGRGDESRGTRQRSGRLDAGARVRADVLSLCGKAIVEPRTRTESPLKRAHHHLFSRCGRSSPSAKT